MPTKKKITNRDLNDIDKAQVSSANLRHTIRFEIEREEILGKYWELANLDPEATKGNITGQLKALDSLCDALGMAKAAQESGQGGAQLDIYRSAWMPPAFRDTPAGST